MNGNVAVVSAESIGEEAQAPALPLGRRTPRGSLRWYFVQCPRGREQALCAQVRKLVAPDVLRDAFVPRVERIKKFHGVWTTSVRDLFRGYFIAATTDAPALSRALAKLTLPVQLAGSVGRGYAPMDTDAQTFLEQSMDATHTIRQSEGEIVRDQLHVLWGPLKGQEDRVSRVVRAKSMAFVRMGNDQFGGFTLAMPLAIPVRR